MNKIHVSVADWQKDIAEIRRIREAVFIAEQSVPPELEWDADDASAVHFLAFEGDFPIGTARLLPEVATLSFTEERAEQRFADFHAAPVPQDRQSADLTIWQ